MATIGLQALFLVALGGAAVAAPRFPLERISVAEPDRVIEWPTRAGVATDSMDSGEAWASAPPVSLDAKLAMEKTSQSSGDYYTIAVDVGTPPKSVKLQVATGSPITWVDYTKMPALLNSTTAKNLGSEIEYSSGRGSAVGVAFKDKFCLKGATSGPLCVAKQPYILSDEVSGFSSKKDFGGMFGLGSPSVFDTVAGLQVPGNSFVVEANTSKLATNFAFGLSLKPSASFVTFGDLKDVMAEVPQGSGSPVTLPLSGAGDDKMFWNVQMSMAVATKKGEIQLAKDVNVKLDSGSQIITAPAKAEDYLQTVIEMLQEHPNNEEIGQMVRTMQREVNTYKSMFDVLVQELTSQACETTEDNIICYCNATLQPLTFTLNGGAGKAAKITLTSSDLLTQIAKTKAGDPVCRVNIQQGSEAFWTVGSAFLKKAYIVHDVKGKKVTFFPTPTASAAALSAVADSPSALSGNHQTVAGGHAMPALSIAALLGLFVGSLLLLTLRLRRGTSIEGRKPLLVA